MSGDFIFTSESVTEGHPDKLCDQISDALVDHFLQQDPLSVVAAECAVATGILFISARFASEGRVDIPGVARTVIADAGYDHAGFDPRTCSVMTSLSEFPIAARPARDERHLTDDEIEGIVADHHITTFGYACRQSPGLLPLPIWLAHRLARRLADVRRRGDLGYLAPDGKIQVAVEYSNQRPVRIHGVTVIAATIEDGMPTPNQLRDNVMDLVVQPAFAEEDVRPNATTRVFINPGGPFLVGGPAMHSGLTGRKVGVDTYGEYARQSGSALSGKDPGRIDRIGAYAARYAARNVVAAGLADTCEVQLTYSIGQSRPVSLQVTTDRGETADAAIAVRLAAAFDFRVAGILRAFGLRDLPAASPFGFFRRLAAYGHVGRIDIELPWERADLVDALR